MSERKQISDFDAIGEAVTTSNIVHTKDSGGVDVTMTISDIVGLTPDPQPAAGTMVAADNIVFADGSDNQTIKRESLESFKTLLNVATITSDFSTDGYADVGGLQIRWGTGDSTTDSAQSFNFAQNFSNECFAVITNTITETRYALSVSSKAVSNFTVNRSDDIDGTVQFNWIAIGH